MELYLIIGHKTLLIRKLRKTPALCDYLSKAPSSISRGKYTITFSYNLRSF
jgi:hypothetical protein